MVLCAPTSVVLEFTRHIRLTFGVMAGADGWNIMCLYLPFVGYGIVVAAGQSWRALQGWAGLVLIAHGLLVLRYVPESPRWLLERRRAAEVGPVMQQLGLEWPAGEELEREVATAEAAQSEPEPGDEEGSEASAVGVGGVLRDVVAPLLRGPTALTLFGINFLWFAASISCECPAPRSKSVARRAPHEPFVAYHLRGCG